MSVMSNLDLLFHELLGSIARSADRTGICTVLLLVHGHCQGCQEMGQHIKVFAVPGTRPCATGLRVQCGYLRQLSAIVHVCR